MNNNIVPHLKTLNTLRKVIVVKIKILDNL